MNRRQLEKLVNGRLPLLEIERVVGSQAGLAARFLRSSQLPEPIVEVIQRCPDRLFVATGACPRQLAKARHDAPDAEAIELLRLLGRKLIRASRELVESRDIHAAAEGLGHLRAREAGGVPLLTRAGHRRTAHDGGRALAGAAAAAALGRHLRGLRLAPADISLSAMLQLMQFRLVQEFGVPPIVLRTVEKEALASRAGDPDARGCEQPASLGQAIS